MHSHCIFGEKHVHAETRSLQVSLAPTLNLHPLVGICNGWVYSQLCAMNLAQPDPKRATAEC